MSTTPEYGTPLLSVDEAAIRLSCSRRTVYNLIATGKLATIKVGALRRIRIAEVERYLRESEVRRLA